MVHVKEEGDRCVKEVRDVELIFTLGSFNRVV